MDTLQDFVSPSGEKIIAFSSGWCPLALSHPCKLTINNVRYSSANQFYKASVAKECGDITAYQMIMSSHKAKTQSDIAALTKGFIAAEWEAKAQNVLETGLLYRFQQDSDAKNLLLSTGDALIVFISPFDPLLGNGLTADSEQNSDPTAYTGKNLLGKCLMSIRSDLMHV